MKPKDIRAAEDLLPGVSILVKYTPEIFELDLNPIKLMPLNEAGLGILVDNPGRTVQL